MTYKIESDIKIPKNTDQNGRLSRSNRVPIVVFNRNGKRIKRYKSIYSFLKTEHTTRKLGPENLERLRKGIPVFIFNKIVMMAKKVQSKKTFNPLLVPFLRAIHDREVRQRKQKLQEVIKSEVNRILVFDKNLNLIESGNPTIEELAKKYNIPEGTIKSSLHRGLGETQIKKFNLIEHSRFKGIYFSYLKDLLLF